MKKRMALLLVTLSLVFAFVSCDALIAGSLQGDNTGGQTESDTYVSPEDATEPSKDLASEAPTVLFPDEGEEMPTFENEDLNALVADLQAQGHDMKQLTFSDVGDSREVLYYTAQLSARAVQRGETLGFKITDLYFWCQSPDYDFNEFLDEVVTVCFVKDGSQNFLTQFQSVGDGVFLFTVPEDCEPGIYNVFLWVEEWTLLVAPVIVY